MVSQTVYVTEDGEILSLEIPVINKGDNAATNVKVLITYGSGLEYYGHANAIGTYNSITKKWTLSSLPGHSGRLLLLDLKVPLISALPLDVAWSVESDNPDIESSNDDCGKWTVAVAPVSTAANCVKYPIQGNVLCDKIVECGCCDRTFELVGTPSRSTITLDAVTGDYKGYALSEGNLWSFQWRAICDCEEPVIYGPFTVSGSADGAPAQITTVNDTATPIALFTMPDDIVCEVDYTVCASTGGGIGVYRRLLRLKRIAGTVSILNESTVGTDQEDIGIASASVAGSVSGSSIRVTVTGLPATNIVWGVSFSNRIFDL